MIVNSNFVMLRHKNVVAQEMSSYAHALHESIDLNPITPGEEGGGTVGSDVTLREIGLSLSDVALCRWVPH